MKILITGALGHIGSYVAENIYKIKKVKEHEHEKNHNNKERKHKILVCDFWYDMQILRHQSNTLQKN